MRFTRCKALVLLTLGFVFFSACSTDPNVRKLQYVNSGKKYFDKGKYQEAIVEFRNAIEIDPKVAAAHYQLARTYLTLKNPGAAFGELQQTVARDPKNLNAQLELASLLVAGRKFDQAQSAANVVLKADPNNARAHALLGESLAATHDLPNAISEFQKAV